MYSVLPLFSTPLYKSKVDFENNVVEYIRGLDYITFGPGGMVNCYKSKNNFILNDPVLFNLKIQIQNNIDIFLKEALKISQRINFFITNSWVIKHHTNHWAQEHIHNNCLFSGVVYLQVDENSGSIFFNRTGPSTIYPDQLILETSEGNMFNSKKLHVYPEDKDILIFPSSLSHGVTHNKSLKDRYVLAFNVFMSGTLGADTIQELTVPPS